MSRDDFFLWLKGYIEGKNIYNHDNPLYPIKVKLSEVIDVPKNNPTKPDTTITNEKQILND